MKIFRKNERPLNLFTASILLIAFMVLVSVAVNLLTGTQAQRTSLIEDLKVSSVSFSGGNTLDMIVNNSGTVDFVIAEVWINNEKQAFTTNPSIGKIPPNGSMEISVNHAYVNGTNYHIKIVSDNKNEYFASATALQQICFDWTGRDSNRCGELKFNFTSHRDSSENWRSRMPI